MTFKLIVLRKTKTEKEATEERIQIESAAPTTMLELERMFSNAVDAVFGPFEPAAATQAMTFMDNLKELTEKKKPLGTPKPAPAKPEPPLAPTPAPVSNKPAKMTELIGAKSTGFTLGERMGIEIAESQPLSKIKGEPEVTKTNSSTFSKPFVESFDIIVQIYCCACGEDHTRKNQSTNRYVKCRNCNTKLYMRPAEENEILSKGVTHVAEVLFLSPRELYDLKNSQQGVDGIGDN